MTARQRGRVAIAVWLVVVATAIAIIAHARFTADLSAFLPTKPTAEQALLIDQLREGPASHLILMAIASDRASDRASDPAPNPGVDPRVGAGVDTGVHIATLAKLSKAMAAKLRGDDRFLSVNNGETTTASRDRELMFNHRYLLSDRVVAARFTAAGLRDALSETLDLLASSVGLMVQPLLARDPTAELVTMIDRLTAGRELPMVDGTWLARSNEEGPHALLVAETRAAGSDIDGQQVAIEALRAAFTAARAEVGAEAASTRLVLSGPPLFAVDARNTIEREARHLSTIGAVLVALLLGFVYRSLRALVLGLVPMATGALCGLAVVAAGFGVVHGIALGFGVTLIGEAVDYAIYLFVQGRATTDAPSRHGTRGFWSTIALGVATSAIGFGALTFSGFEGLAQIGVLSIAGLVAAALVTRYVVPAWMPDGFRVRAMPRLGDTLERLAASASRARWVVAAFALIAVGLLVAHRDALWSRELGSLSPVSSTLQEIDGRLRSELGAPDVRDVVVVGAPDEESALRNSERVVDALAPLVADGTLVGVESPSKYLPSQATQRARQAALPDDATLRRDFAAALDGLPFVKTGFDGFFDDVAREKRGPTLTRADLEGTSIGPAVRALLSRQGTPAGAPARWTAIVALRSPAVDRPVAAGAPTTRARIATALAPLTATSGGPRTTDDVDIRAIDIKAETQALYADYLSEALRMAAFGALAIVALLAVVLRDATRLFRVVLPLVAAVLLVAAGHVALEGPLTLFHFIGLLLIVAVGSNYTLFFDRRAHLPQADERTADHALLVSLVVANLTGVIGFGVLALSSLPILHAIGTTVAPGALLALAGSAVFAASVPRTRAASGSPA